MNLENLTVIWITRKADHEINWIKQYLNKYKDSKFKKMVVGFSNLPQEEFNYTYIPFWENGLDNLGLIGHKKNIAIKNACTENVLLLHADCCLKEESIKALENIIFDDETAYGVVGYIEGTNQRGFTWLDRLTRGEDFVKLPLEEMIKTRSTSFICGAAIAGKRNIFLNIPWNENLRHNQGEDSELCLRLTNSNIKLVCLPQLIIDMKNDR